MCFIESKCWSNKKSYNLKKVRNRRKNVEQHSSRSKNQFFERERGKLYQSVKTIWVRCEWTPFYVRFVDTAKHYWKLKLRRSREALLRNLENRYARYKCEINGILNGIAPIIIINW